MEEGKFQQPVSGITIRGYKSIQALENFELRALNVLIGANGAGKSNFIGALRLLSAAASANLRLTVARAGGAELLRSAIPESSSEMTLHVELGGHSYALRLGSSAQDHLFVVEETLAYRQGMDGRTQSTPATAGEAEASLKRMYELAQAASFATLEMQHLRVLFRSMTGWMVYHFHDTGDHAPPKKRCALVDGVTLREDGANLAAFLFTLSRRHPLHYKRITDTVRLVAPFFDEFYVEPLADNSEQTQLRWRQKGSSQIFQASQLSDGTLRFIALATALGQPNPPATILLDEPELGLHPYALEVLGSMLASTSHHTQLIVSTQSAALLNHVEPEDVVVVERSEDGASTFRRLERAALASWLEDYSLAELWLKNVLGGRP